MANLEATVLAVHFANQFGKRLCGMPMQNGRSDTFGTNVPRSGGTRGPYRETKSPTKVSTERMAERVETTKTPRSQAGRSICAVQDAVAPYRVVTECAPTDGEGLPWWRLYAALRQ